MHKNIFLLKFKYKKKSHLFYRLKYLTNQKSSIYIKCYRYLCTHIGTRLWTLHHSHWNNDAVCCELETFFLLALFHNIHTHYSYLFFFFCYVRFCKKHKEKKKNNKRKAEKEFSQPKIHIHREKQPNWKKNWKKEKKKKCQRRRFLQAVIFLSHQNQYYFNAVK